MIRGLPLLWLLLVGAAAAAQTGDDASLYEYLDVDTLIIPGPVSVQDIDGDVRQKGASGKLVAIASGATVKPGDVLFVDGSFTVDGDRFTFQGGAWVKFAEASGVRRRDPTPKLLPSKIPIPRAYAPSRPGNAKSVDAAEPAPKQP